MTIERIIPQGMQSGMPIAVTASPGKETARVENIRGDQCPICYKTFRLSEANGIPVLVCDAHAIVMPLKDKE